jgi:hypothetical protein
VLSLGYGLFQHFLEEGIMMQLFEENWLELA